MRRGQSPDNEVAKLVEAEEQDNTKYISENCGLWGFNFAVIEGIGLAVGLDGTGSEPASSGAKEHLVSELQSRGVEDSKRLVASQNTAIVTITGKLPPGIKKGEAFDIEVKALNRSGTTSLSDGFLLQTRLRPLALLGRSIKEGHILGYGKGEVLTAALFETRDDEPNQVRGLVLGGGKAHEDRPFGLTLRTDQSVRTSTSIAGAINDRFTAVGPDGRHGAANPKTDKLIELEVPQEYRLNVGRFAQLVSNIAYDETVSERVERLDLLNQQLLDSGTAELAALRLEAFGSEGIPALKRALRHDDPEVKFYAAQSLAYMGEIDGVDHLESMAAGEPAFRWHALTSLASMDHIAASVALSRLMHVDSAEARYGAFRAMTERSPGDPLVAARWLSESFFLARVDSATVDPILHFSRSKRPEIVAFGDATVSNTFLYVETGLTVKAVGNGQVKISTFGKDGKEQKTCGNSVTDIVESLASFNCKYSTLLTMFRGAKQKGDLNARLVVNAVPRLNNGENREIVGDYTPEESTRFVSGKVPDMFQPGGTVERQIPRVEKPITDVEDKESGRSKRGSSFAKLTDWFSAR